MRTHKAELRLDGDYLISVAENPRINMITKAPFLFISAIFAQAGTLPNPVMVDHSGEFVKWAIQSGSFAAVFTAMAILAIKWLATHLMLSKQQEVDILKTTVLQNAEITSKAIVVLERVEGVMTRFGLVMDRMDRRLDRAESRGNDVLRERVNT
jgi:hypothetical protein